jgi:hypothetical protein
MAIGTLRPIGAIMYIVDRVTAVAGLCRILIFLIDMTGVTGGTAVGTM